MAEFRTEMHDGVAVIRWDVPGRSMNVMTRAGLADLAACVDAALGDGDVRGIVITSAGRDFAGGMDLALLAEMKRAAGADPARGIFDAVQAIHALLRRIERAGMDPATRQGAKPVACALPGTAVGIGLELALACHRILVADRADARIGLPEIKVGLFPGAGGTTRLVRKLGVMAAAPFLLEGRMVAPEAARSAGLVDEVVPADDLLARAIAWVRGATAAECTRPWDLPGHRMPGGAPYATAGFPTFVGASAMVTGRTQGVYPAAAALMSAMYEGALVDFDTALRIEARWFTHVLMDPTAEAMIRTLFLDKSALEKGARRPSAPQGRVARLGVVGAGMMGAGIAQAAASAGIEVVLTDATADAAARGRDTIARALDGAVARGRISSDRAAAALARITTASADLRGCDLILEAVPEDPSLKAEVLARAEADAPGATLSSNTSTLPIGDLGRGLRRPEAFVGLHFFSPVDRMPLVEVVRGPATSDATVARAFDFARHLRKTPIVVNDARFFYANRCIIPFLNEGVRMIAEGVAPALVENAARQLGFPVGPLQLIDEVSVALAVRIARETRAAQGRAAADDRADRVILALAEAGRLGRKAGAGFYDYDAQGRRTGLWPGLEGRARPDIATLRDRLIFVQALEAVRALDDGVLEDVREGNVGAVLGWGFAPWSGGPFAWLDRIGADRAVATAEALARDHGARFDPPARLRDMARSGATFG
ncbi:3-hydroxyacyl-CoA dehydrogenase NAD-binding domain-containing protein [Rhodobaculum claviforme]|uniref:3-hydroxyacyl-CoA dehydrogenase n=1 Tax=Rhodobaculum claviforme TaxID=1549854 RepID=A0A934WHU2_9RHOB|nr:3-hydroxyacyl-CoA dehydrogenase NAD-binding domain-containing protein [Rhodobaculum claviforme]MBK5927495.1 3-hydroxyacyl-CoA dehydrogenase [Rhodobaculum claviforme]